LRWLGALGVLTLFTFALIWLATARAGRQERRDGQQHLDVPRACPSCCSSSALTRPSPPVTETVRGLLTGRAIHANAVRAIAWSIGLTVAAYLWAVHRYTHRQPR
jgi:ABC-2 type transport system permease protein